MGTGLQALRLAGRLGVWRGGDVMTDKQKECECKNWCDIDRRARLLTGHHEHCEHGAMSNQRDAALVLIADMAHGLELWAADEDGIHDECWKPYCKAKALEGMFLNPNEPNT